ncbi:MAG: thiamine-phosphate kinase [Elusimicrobiota bacterium]|jgi:thiamine-monophosphate kinase|nr:thiamine-phosphate kinase [Elusimicrobiota bacterium]
MKTSKTISSLGEFGIINLLKPHTFPKAHLKAPLVDIGDDAFCFNTPQGSTISATKDLLIEDVHFKSAWTTPYQLAQKSVEVNISDLASMGFVKPAYILVGLCLPKNTAVTFVKEFARGIKDVCKKYGVYIAGGDTVRGGKIAISITALGFSPQGAKLIKRSGAKAGDLIGVTNTFGDAGWGLKLLSGPKKTFTKDEKYLISRQNSPKARLKEGQAISAFCSAMTDSSDGLFFSIKLIAQASKAGAEIDFEAIPVSKQLKNVVKDRQKIVEAALFGGEDYELTFAVSPKKALKLKKLLPQISYIGRITKTKKVVIIDGNKKSEIKFAGFNHF